MLLKKAEYDRDLRELRTLERTNPGQRQNLTPLIRGVEGEKSAAHYIDREFGHDDRYGILHDIRIGIAGDFAQTDHLIIDRIARTAWVIETKNYDGTLAWNDHGDWKVEYARREFAIESPVAQARRHCASLKLWFVRNGIEMSRVEPIVVVGARTHLRRGLHEADVPVMKADVFPAWLQADRKHAQPANRPLSVAELQDIGGRLAAAHVPQPDIRVRRSVPRQTGVTAAAAWQPNRQRSRSMSRRRSGSIEIMLTEAATSQIGALIFGCLGLVLASPIPHAVLGMVTPAAPQDNIYTGIAVNGALGYAYIIVPWIRIFGLILTGIAVVSMLARSGQTGYRTHLRTVRGNSIAAVTMAAMAALLVTLDTPHLLPGEKEAAEADAVIRGRRPIIQQDGVNASSASTRFPANGTIKWGSEQPIGGNLELLDIWDVTGSPQNKVINVHDGLIMAMPGIQSPPYATIYVQAGQRASIKLPAGRPYRITAMSGDQWNGPEQLFGSGAVTVDFGTVVLSSAQPQVVAMGASDQTATVVPNDRF